MNKVHVVAVSFIELKHRELRVVVSRKTLVAKIAVDLIDAVQATDDQALEVQLRSNPKKQVHIQCIVVSQEWASHRTAVQRLHHGCLHFDIVPSREGLTQGTDNPVASYKCVSYGIVTDQIQGSLPVPDLDILQPMKFLWQWQNALCKVLKT